MDVEQLAELKVCLRCGATYVPGIGDWNNPTVKAAQKDIHIDCPVCLIGNAVNVIHHYIKG